MYCKLIIHQNSVCHARTPEQPSVTAGLLLLYVSIADDPVAQRPWQYVHSLAWL